MLYSFKKLIKALFAKFWFMSPGTPKKEEWMGGFERVLLVNTINIF